MQLVYSPHKLQKFFLSLKNVYFILVHYRVLNVARHQSFISEETERKYYACAVHTHQILGAFWQFSNL